MLKTFYAKTGPTLDGEWKAFKTLTGRRLGVTGLLRRVAETSHTNRKVDFHFIPVSEVKQVFFLGGYADTCMQR